MSTADDAESEWMREPLDQAEVAAQTAHLIDCIKERDALLAAIRRFVWVCEMGGQTYEAVQAWHDAYAALLALAGVEDV